MLFNTCVYNHSNICNIQIHFCNIHMKQLQHKSEISETLETCVYSHSNICNTQMKHLKHRLASYVYCHCNICNISDILLQHPDKTLEI